MKLNTDAPDAPTILNLHVPEELRDVHDALPAYRDVTLALSYEPVTASGPLTHVIIRLTYRQIFALASADMIGEPAFNTFIRAALAGTPLSAASAKARRSLKQYFVNELDRLLAELKD